MVKSSLLGVGKGSKTSNKDRALLQCPDKLLRSTLPQKNIPLGPRTDASGVKVKHRPQEAMKKVPGETTYHEEIEPFQLEKN